MPRDPRSIERLISEYGRMHALDGFSPQSRGQRLNGLIAEMLRAWGIDAEENVQASGEIDVTFEIGGRHFIAEVKWESGRTDTGTIAKLQKRVRQRLEGTVGVVISIAGFSEPAISDLAHGERLSVLLLTRRHLEAMLAGFIPPEELINTLVRKASRRGFGFSELEDLWDLSNVIPATTTTGLSAPSIILSAESNYDAKVVVSSLPCGTLGVTEMSTDVLLVATQEGILRVPLHGEAMTWAFKIPRCSHLFNIDSSIYIVRHYGIARITDGCLEIIAGGLPITSFSKGPDGTTLLFSTGHIDGYPSMLSVGDWLGSQKKIYDVDLPSWQCCAAYHLEENKMLICGNFGTFIFGPDFKTEIISGRDNPLINPAGLVRLNDDEFLIACHDGLWVLKLSEINLRKVVALQSTGICQLTTGIEVGGYLACCYSDDQQISYGAIVRWKC